MYTENYKVKLQCPVRSIDGPRLGFDPMGSCVLGVYWYISCCWKCKIIAIIGDFVRWANYPPPLLLRFLGFQYSCVVRVKGGGQILEKCKSCEEPAPGVGIRIYWIGSFFHIACRSSITSSIYRGGGLGTQSCPVKGGGLKYRETWLCDCWTAPNCQSSSHSLQTLNNQFSVLLIFHFPLQTLNSYTAIQKYNKLGQSCKEYV